MLNKKVLTIGAAIQDVFLSQSDILRPVCLEPEKCFQELPLGSKTDVNKINFSTGGGATNAAVTLARNGIDTMFMGCIGKDPAGDAVMLDLDKENVDTSKVFYSDKYNTGYSVLLLAPNGERTILTYRGASTHYDENKYSIDDLDIDWLYVSSVSGNMRLLNKLFNECYQKQIKIMFNPGKKELAQVDKLKGLLEDVEILSLNKEEAKMLVPGESSEELARRLLNYVPITIVTDSTNGAVVADRYKKQVITIGLYDNHYSVDRTGAGDAFASGFLAEYLYSEDVKKAITFAAANSSSVVMKIGAKTGIIGRDYPIHEVEMEIKKF